MVSVGVDVGRNSLVILLLVAVIESRFVDLWEGSNGSSSSWSRTVVLLMKRAKEGYLTS